MNGLHVISVRQEIAADVMQL
ncbi:MAG: hypothetical protein JWM85_2652, partial [Acidimicrobiaceae bacterium]|nr:hypothetical protein [Acidimicrobiaceae bacterium]